MIRVFRTNERKDHFCCQEEILKCNGVARLLGLFKKTDFDDHREYIAVILGMFHTWLKIPADLYIIVPVLTKMLKKYTHDINVLAGEKIKKLPSVKTRPFSQASYAGVIASNEIMFNRLKGSDISDSHKVLLSKILISLTGLISISLHRDNHILLMNNQIFIYCSLLLKLDNLLIIQRVCYLLSNITSFPSQDKETEFVNNGILQKFLPLLTICSKESSNKIDSLNFISNNENFPKDDCQLIEKSKISIMENICSSVYNLLFANPHCVDVVLKSGIISQFITILSIFVNLPEGVSDTLTSLDNISEISDALIPYSLKTVSEIIKWMLLSIISCLKSIEECDVILSFNTIHVLILIVDKYLKDSKHNLTQDCKNNSGINAKYSNILGGFDVVVLSKISQTFFSAVYFGNVKNSKKNKYYDVFQKGSSFSL
jgi:hypothetical protein